MKRKVLFFAVMAVILLVGAFLRAWHFSDWLHFELDQARDAKVIDLAVEEGAGNLPLLGPKAAGSFLRLGPIFYYFSYLSALIFGNTPAGIAFITMLFGIAAILMFYLLARRYFERNLSLGLMALFSISIFMVMYSRFSWNPNSLPFFIILSFYALLRAVDREERKKGWWLLLFAFALAVATQLHFLAFVTLPVAAAVFLAIKRPRIKIAYWAGALTIAVFMYLPVIINDIKTGGENFKQFSKVVSKKSTKDSHTPAEKAIRGLSENSLAYFLILSGRMDGELPKVKQGKSLKFNVVCEQDCRNKLLLGILAVFLFALGALLLLRAIILGKKGAEKDFLLLSLVYFLILLAALVPIAYSLSPRFFLLWSFLPFVFLGLILEFAGKFVGKKGFILAIITLAILAASNLWEINKRFSELKKAPLESFKISSDRILKERTRVTLTQQSLIVDFIEDFYKKNKHPVYLKSEAYFQRSFFYHLEKRKIPADKMKSNVDSRRIYQKGNYFLIYPTLSNIEEEKSRYLDYFHIILEKRFGTLTVFQLLPKPEAVTDLEQRFEPRKKPTSATGVPVRCRWNEIFKKCNPDEIISGEGEEEQ